jgi:hypothetical protein
MLFNCQSQTISEDDWHPLKNLQLQSPRVREHSSIGSTQIIFQEMIGHPLENLQLKYLLGLGKTF